MNFAPRLTQAAIGVGVGLVLLTLFARIHTMAANSSTESSQAVSAPQPIIAIDATEWDFGRVPSNGFAKAEFTIRNIGSGRLILQKSNGDCDCVSTSQAPLIIEPGGRRTVVAELDTRRVLGPVRVGLHFHTNAPQRPKLSLFCVADVAVQ